jgi:predicted aspartyl protease
MLGLMVHRLVGFVTPTQTYPATPNKWEAKLQEVTLDLEVESSSCFLNGTIYGKKARFLLDTGASMSIITKSALREMPDNHRLSSTRTICRTADGSEVKIYGLCILELEIKGVKFPLTLYHW